MRLGAPPMRQAGGCSAWGGGGGAQRPADKAGRSDGAAAWRCAGTPVDAALRADAASPPSLWPPGTPSVSLANSANSHSSKKAWICSARDDRSLSAQPSSAAADQWPRFCVAPGCGATRGLHRCTACKSVSYCSETCQRAHWKEHRSECKRLRSGGGGSGWGRSGPIVFGVGLNACLPCSYLHSLFSCLSSALFFPAQFACSLVMLVACVEQGSGVRRSCPLPQLSLSSRQLCVLRLAPEPVCSAAGWLESHHTRNAGLLTGTRVAGPERTRRPNR